MQPRYRVLTCVCLALSLVSPVLAGENAWGDLTLTSTPNPSVLGAPVTLSVHLTPPATGKVTFFDGVNLLGVSQIAGGEAKLTTSLLPFGSRRLRARYVSSAGGAQGETPITVHEVAARAARVVQRSTPLLDPSEAADVSVADFNRDGKPDLAIAGWRGSVNVVMGRGDGTFLPRIEIPDDAGKYGKAMAVGDFDEDGTPDLVVSSDNTSREGKVAVLLGNGDGGFRRLPAYELGGAPRSMAVADFNRDGHADVAVGREWDNFVVLLGKGDGTFEIRNAPVLAAPYPGTVSGVLSVAVDDFNGDHAPDLVLCQRGSYASTVIVLNGDGDGGFRWFTSYSTPAGSTITTADFNADGFNDIAIGAESTAIILLGDGGQGFRKAGEFRAFWSSDPINGLAPGDFDGDGIMDLACAYTEFTVFLGRGDGTLVRGGSFWGAYHVKRKTRLLTADFNGDGRTDFATDSPPSVLFGAAVADLAIEGVRTEPLARGQTAAISVLVKNVGLVPTQGRITMKVDLPLGLILRNVEEPGWSCTTVDVSKSNTFGVSTSTTCSRDDSLHPGASFPEVRLVFEVSTYAPDLIWIGAEISGGGDEYRANDSWGESNVPVTGPSTRPVIRSVVDGATFEPRPLAPRQHFTIFLDYTPDMAIAGPDPVFELAGVEVTVCSRPARMVYVGNGQINAIYPAKSVLSLDCGVMVVFNTPIGRISYSHWVRNAATSLSLFLFASKNGIDPLLPVVTAVDNTLTGPPADGMKPARPGDTVVLWGTGCGNPSGLADDINTPMTGVAMGEFPTVKIGGIVTPTLWAGLAPGWVGLCQFNVTVPAGVSASEGSDGLVPLEIGGRAYSLALQN